ncbi:hypothetical protein B9Z65_8792 [Elsinoe australis]|uniref:Uncharacterized protein n=1 Tax=Elsinoe australis TaxID=40998 RepID=A0A2P7YES2_9PEZI|nr:hypothetical protein B9Z65_8792 [Elsinoe australis]
MNIGQLLNNSSRPQHSSRQSLHQPDTAQTAHAMQQPQYEQEQTWSAQTQQDYDMYQSPSPESSNGSCPSSSSPFSSSCSKDSKTSSTKGKKPVKNYKPTTKKAPKHDEENTIRQRDTREWRHDFLNRADRILSSTGCTKWEKQHGLAEEAAGMPGCHFNKEDILAMLINRAELLDTTLPYTDLSDKRVRGTLDMFDEITEELQGTMGGWRGARCGCRR